MHSNTGTNQRQGNNNRRQGDENQSPAQQQQSGAATRQQQQQQQQQPGGMSIWKMMLMFFVVNQIINFFMQQVNPQKNPNLFSNVFEVDEPFEFRMYISNSSIFDPMDLEPVWIEKNLSYNYDPSNKRELVLDFNFEDQIAKNETISLWAHFFLDSLRDPQSANYSQIAHHLFLYEKVSKYTCSRQKAINFELSF